jgi:hypothetical protein
VSRVRLKEMRTGRMNSDAKSGRLSDEAVTSSCIWHYSDFRPFRKTEEDYKRFRLDVFSTKRYLKFEGDSQLTDPLI